MQKIFPILFLMLLACFFSCKETRIRSSSSPQNDQVIKKPVFIPAGTPHIINLDTCPQPQRIRIPAKDSGFINFKTANWERKLKIVPPVSYPADFFVAMTKFSNEEGLEAHSVFSSFQDKQGNLWFGTHGGGVTRFDGRSAVTFTDLNCNDVRAFTEDKDGNTWLGMGGCGLIKYDGRAMTSYSTAEGLLDNEVRALTIDQKGNLWVGTDAKGACCFNGTSFTPFTTDSGLVNSWVKCIVPDKKGNLWFATNGGVSRYDGKKFYSITSADGLVNDFVRSIICDRKGDLWFGTANGVSRYDGKTFTNFTVADGMVGNNITSLKEDKDGNIWMGTYGTGVSKYNGHSFENLTKKQGLASDFVITITEDKNGNLWFGAEGGGATKYEGSAVTHYSTEQGLANHYIVSIAEDKSGNLWLGPNAGGIYQYDGRSFKNFTWNQGFAQNRVNYIYPDTKGNIWFCTNNGFTCYDGSSFTNYNKLHGIPNDEVRCVTEDPSGNLWFGIENGGLVKFDGQSMTIYSVKQGLPSNNIRSIINDDAGGFWIATYGRGISRFDGESFINFDTAQGITENRVLCMKKDSKGNIWIGTSYHGVSILRKEVIEKINAGEKLPGRIFEKFTTLEGLANNVVYDIVEDNRQNIIVGTNFGLTIIKNGLMPGKEIVATDLEQYNQKTGYAIPDMNGQAMFADSKGMIWGGTGHDLVKFDYSAVRKNPDQPAVMIQGIKINNDEPGWYKLLYDREPLPADSGNYMGSAIETEENLFYATPRSQTFRDSLGAKYKDLRFDSISRYYPVPLNLQLPYRHNNIAIEFAVIETSRPDQIRYQYKLEGYDKDWSSVTNQSSATFGNIDEGSYTFKVKAMSPDGVWGESASFSFRVLPPYWRSWWFRSLYIILSVSLLFFLIRWRINTVRKNEQKKIAHEKELLELEARALRAQMNPHFIFNSLNSIKSLINKGQNDRAAGYLTTFSKLIRTLFQNSDRREVSLYEELETCRLYTQLEKMRFGDKVEFTFDVDEHLDLKDIKVPA
ncbi:MAG TPA: two-component regulator propeller domain-containing protein, partial [Chitinophagaceae bacterium]